MVGGYCYMDWELEDDSALEDLQIHGPVIGPIFAF